MGNLKTFKTFYEENVKPVVVTFGRFNPPTIGHEKLLDTVASIAGKNPYRIYASQSQDPKKNPLSYEEKIKFLRKMFPKYARNIISDTSIKTLLGIAFVLNREGFNHLIFVVGSDRVDDVRDTLIKYNGGRYNFEKIEVISAGERDPDADEVSAMSASKLRAAAAEGDLSAFSKGMPKNFGEVQDLFNAVRRGMGLKEMAQFRKHIELAPVSEIRDLYVKGEIFLEGSKVRDSKEQVYTIKERKTNFVVCISESGKECKFWLKDIQPFQENKGSENVGDIFKKLKKVSKVDLSGGNCGQSAYAVYRFVKEKFGKTYNISFVTNAEEESELIKGEPDVYHVVLEKDGKYYDENGNISESSLVALASDQYGNKEPNLFTFKMPSEEKNALTVISTQTNYNADWNYFYNLLDQKNESLNEETYDGDSFFEKYGVIELDLACIQEAEYQGRKVELNKPMKGDVKKFKVYVKNKKGNVVKVNFGDPNMTIKKHIPARRKSFRARHKCDTDPAEKDTARYWSCRMW